MRLDTKDQKIMFLLSKNARMSYSELGKLTRLSRDVVKYRMEKLLDAGVVKAFKTVINYRLLGFKETGAVITKVTRAIH